MCIRLLLLVINTEDAKKLYKSFYLFLQVQVVTTGWVSLALTFRGSLISSDIILGWIAPTGAATLIVSLLLFKKKSVK